MKWRTQKRLRDYYFSINNYSAWQRNVWYINLIVVLSVVILWKAGDFQQVILAFTVLGGLLIYWLRIANKRVLANQKRICYETLAEAEVKRRLDKADTREILGLIMEKIQAKYPVFNLIWVNEHLEGEYRDEKIAIYYQYTIDEGVLETRDVLAILRECRQNGIKQVRLFSNGAFSPKAAEISERYEIEARFYNDMQMKAFLADTRLYPSAAELESMVRREYNKRQRKITIIKKQAFQGNKFVHYLIYSFILFWSAWFKIGLVYVNLTFAVILLLLALRSFQAKFVRPEDEFIF